MISPIKRRISFKKKKETVLIDMDNVLCDFTKSYERHLKKEPGIIYPQCQHKFFERLESVPGAIKAYWKLKEHFHVDILTKPSVWNPMSYTEKRIWVEEHLGFKECDNLIMSTDKTKVVGDYLIDDFDQPGRNKPTWEHIKFGTPQFPNWDIVLEYLIPKK